MDLRIMPRKKTIEEVRKEFSNIGYTLLDNIYIDSHTKLNFICSKKHTCSISRSSLLNGNRCGKCAGLYEDIENIRKEFESEGYKLLSKQYKRAHDKLNFICPKDHKHFISWSKWKLGRRCGKCAGKYKYIEDIKKEFKSEGYQLLETNYKGTKHKYDFICPEGHKHYINLSSWNKGNRCGKCVGLYININDIKADFQSKGYLLITNKYKNAHQKLYFICPNNHKHFTTLNNWNKGKRCGQCFPGGYDPKEPGILYYIKFFTKIGILYKIGITNNSILHRFDHEKTPYIIIKEWKNNNGKIIFNTEQKLLKIHSKFRYKGDKILKCGNTELFTKDVLGLDKQKSIDLSKRHDFYIGSKGLINCI